MERWQEAKIKAQESAKKILFIENNYTTLRVVLLVVIYTARSRGLLAIALFSALLFPWNCRILKMLSFGGKL